MEPNDSSRKLLPLDISISELTVGPATRNRLSCCSLYKGSKYDTRSSISTLLSCMVLPISFLFHKKKQEPKIEEGDLKTENVKLFWRIRVGATILLKWGKGHLAMPPLVVFGSNLGPTPQVKITWVRPWTKD